MSSLRRVALAAVLITVGVGLTAAPAYAGTGRGPQGQTLAVTPSTGLPRTGTTVTVKGSGYDVTKGIYVAFCVDNGAGAMPTPCGGGADTTGSLGASHWISSKPPTYAEGLTTPYGPGGSFQLTLQVPASIGAVDCTTRRCVVSTRADHTRAADRSQDVRVPVTFAAAGPAPTRSSTAPAGATGSGPGSTGTGRPAAPAPAAAPAGGAPAAAAPGAPVPGSAVPAPSAADATEVQVSRVSTASSTGRWWSVALAVVAGGLMVLVGLRWRRRRGAAR